MNPYQLLLASKQLELKAVSEYCVRQLSVILKVNPVHKGKNLGTFSRKILTPLVIVSTRKKNTVNSLMFAGINDCIFETKPCSQGLIFTFSSSLVNFLGI